MVTATPTKQKTAAELEREIANAEESLEKLDREFKDELDRRAQRNKKLADHDFEALGDKRTQAQRGLIAAREALVQTRAIEERRRLDKITPPRPPDAELDALIAQREECEAGLRAISDDPELASLHAALSEYSRLRAADGGHLETKIISENEQQRLGREHAYRARLLNARRQDLLAEESRLEALIKTRAQSLYFASCEDRLGDILAHITQTMPVVEEMLLVRRSYELDAGVFTDSVAGFLTVELARIVRRVEAAAAIARAA